MFKELKADLGIERTDSDLGDWAQQGVSVLCQAYLISRLGPAVEHSPLRTPR